ncbi:HNH endonuclease, partial [Streptomyces sp. 2MCAF27]
MLLAVAGCTSGAEKDGDGRDGGERSSSSGGPQGDGRAVSPLKNPDGTKPGLAPVTSAADKAAARRLIDQLLTKGRGPRTGYERD